jgi:hypothetical protein
MADHNKEDNIGYERGIQSKYRNSQNKSHWNSGNEKLNKLDKNSVESLSRLDQVEDSISEFEDKVGI